MDRHEKLLSYKKIEYDIYNEILLSHIKEQNNAICSNRDIIRDLVVIIPLIFLTT